MCAWSYEERKGSGGYHQCLNPATGKISFDSLVESGGSRHGWSCWISTSAQEKYMKHTLDLYTQKTKLLVVSVLSGVYCLYGDNNNLKKNKQTNSRTGWLLASRPCFLIN